MKIYTSYFAKLRKLPDTVMPISIAGKSPDWYDGIVCKKLMPKYDWWKEWHDKNLGEEWYIKKYYETVLSEVDAKDLVQRLEKISEGKDVALVCYEKPGDFCHRNIVADWLRKEGFEVEEWKDD